MKTGDIHTLVTDLVDKFLTFHFFLLRNAIKLENVGYLLASKVIEKCHCKDED